eukprot:6998001-Pyramimonas_sp.AAC.1
MAGEEEAGDGPREFSGAVLTDGSQQAPGGNGAAGGLSAAQLRELIAGVVRETISATASAAAASGPGEKKHDVEDPWQQAASSALGASAAARRD